MLIHLIFPTSFTGSSEILLAAQSFVELLTKANLSRQEKSLIRIIKTFTM